MTKTRQRERKKRRQAEMQAGAGVSTVKDEQATDETMVKIVDVLFRGMAEKAAAENDISIEDAIEGSWTLFEAGFLRLVAGDDDRVGIKPCREAVPSSARRRGETGRWSNSGAGCLPRLKAGLSAEPNTEGASHE